MTHRTTFIAFLLLFASTSGCFDGPDLGDGGCEFDSECRDGEMACHQRICTEICETAEDCRDGEECRPRPYVNEQQICISEDAGCDSNNPCAGTDNCIDGVCAPGDECTTHADCGDLHGPDFFCSPERECVLAAQTYYNVEIHDVSPSARCPDAHPNHSQGAKIMYVALHDENDATLAYGSLVKHIVPPRHEGTYNDAETVLNGQPPILNGPSEGCIHPDDFNTDNILALGCDGLVVVDFRAEGTRIPLHAGYSITVGEFGNYCHAAFGDDLYDVSICTDTSETLTDASSCTHLLGGELTGIATVAVTSP